ncbi:EamA family transporter [Demequina sp. SYSU T00068]|uniref:EamA family transporter n=1 Tax=Demequina lignilytica TaxID=3051663 RepID=UPI0026355232|nr:EamA family transporter [Demequina sp. SYSU T00068]MDN4491061.1 EamA family transporter [Demequina sp. SYSU T00068]
MKAARRTGLALAGVTALISGVAVYVNGNGVAAYGDATAYTTAKNLMAALVIGLVFATVRRSRGGSAASFTRPARPGQWAGLAYVAVLGGAVPFVMFFEGLASTASTQAAFLHKLLVVGVAVLAVVVLKERLTWWHLGAIALLVLAQLGLAGDISLVGDPGTALVAGATALWAVEVVVAKRLLAGMTPWTVSITRMAGGSLALLAWCGATGRLGAVMPATAAQWSWVIVTGVLLAGYVLTWHQALARAQAVDVTAVLVLGALVTAALAGVLDGAALGAQAPWLALMLTGGLLVWIAPARHRNPAPRRAAS